MVWLQDWRGEGRRGEKTLRAKAERPKEPLNPQIEESGLPIRGKGGYLKILSRASHEPTCIVEGSLWLLSGKQNREVTHGATTAISVSRDGGPDLGGVMQMGKVGRFKMHLENLEVCVESVAEKVFKGVETDQFSLGHAAHPNGKKKMGMPSVHGCNQGAELECHGVWSADRWRGDYPPGGREGSRGVPRGRPSRDTPSSNSSNANNVVRECFF